MSSQFNLLINSPLKKIELSGIESVQIETNQGSYEFLSDHFNFGTSVNIGECKVITTSKIDTYNIFSGSIYFDNDKNTLFIYCLDYWVKNQNITNFENILQTYKKSKVSNNNNDLTPSSKFKLNFTKDYNISLDIEDLKNE